MTKMNWERASQRSRMYEGMGYLDRVEAADERWAERENAREARLESARRERAAKKAVQPLTKAEKQALTSAAKKLGISTQRYGDAKLQQLFSGIGAEATRLKVDVGVLRRRRLLALNAGHSVKEILEAGRLEGPIGAGPLTKPASRAAKTKRKPPARSVAPLPISTAERLRREAEASGRTLQQTAGYAPGGSAQIVSRGVGRPPTARSTPVPAAQRPKPSAAKAKQAKAQRDRAEAARRGMTVDQLIAERRKKAAADAALAAEAKALGLTTKQLRKQRSV